jgi:hypothetical protein
MRVTGHSLSSYQERIRDTTRSIEAILDDRGRVVFRGLDAIGDRPGNGTGSGSRWSAARIEEREDAVGGWAVSSSRKIPLI